jgi:hypothetical protein
MCRYAFKRYKSHFVCFDCRKSFKQSPVEDLAMRNGDWKNYKRAFWNIDSDQRKQFVKENSELVKELEHKYIDRKVKCPNCSQLMVDMGFDFKAPKKDKIKEWEIIKGLLKTGRIFHTCGCSGIGYIPKKINDYFEYLNKQRDYYNCRLENRDALLNNENVNDYINRFSELIQLINIELEKINK